jgi:hypothetical protein
LLSRRFKKKKETRLAVERLESGEDITISLQVGRAGLGMLESRKEITVSLQGWPLYAAVGRKHHHLPLGKNG